MVPFADYFTDEAIIDELCKIRVRSADVRHKRLFFRQISSDVREPSPDIELDMFPPRRQWNRYRNNHRHGQSGLDVNCTALKRAAMKLRVQAPLPLWADRLSRKVLAIRQRALHPDGFRFEKPDIMWQEKDKAKAQYRPIAQFGIDDKVIDSLTARYLRESLDRLFTPSSMAFRCRRDGNPPPTHHDALNQIANFRRYHARTGLYVAECDIMGFYDCVDHQVALQAFSDLIDAARRKDLSCIIDERAVQIFRAYLDCYTFPQNIKAEAEPALKTDTHNPAAHFKWPEKELRDFHKDPGPLTANIGVPQGGALSCFIANCVLHQADLQVLRCKKERARHPGICGTFRYLRFCDDMVLLAPDRSTCEIVFSIYQDALKRLHLPAHPPKRIEAYGKEFWNEKSKAPYFWSKPGGKEVVPWVQFVGYQVRYDGMLRITNKAFKKHRKKLTTEADQLLDVLNPGRRAPEEVPPFSPGIRKNPRRIILRFRARLNAISVGRRKLGDDLGKLSPICWVSGFKALKGKRIPLGMFRALDRHRERQIYRIIRRVRTLGRIEDRRGSVDSIRVPRYYGYPFSYVAQFATPPATRTDRRTP